MIAEAEQIKTLTDCSKLYIPGFKGDIYPFQKKGIAWMYYAENCLLADQCGLGKTIQCLGLILLLKKRHELRRALIAVPSAGCALEQWADEIRRFTDLSVAVVGHKSRVKRLEFYRNRHLFDIFLINHELIKNDESYLRTLGFDLLFVDEGSAIKNHKAQLSKSMKRLARCTDRRVVASATPAQNNLMDLHSIFEVIDKNILDSYTAFKTKYCEEEVVLYLVQTAEGVRRKSIWYRLKPGEFVVSEIKRIVGSRNIAELKELIKPYTLRRRVEEVENSLPEVIVRDVWLNLTKEQKELYDAIRKKTVDSLSAGKYEDVKKNMHTLQQSVDGTASLPQIDDDSSCKLDFVEELLQGDLAGEKVVIFSFYKKTIETLTRRCNTNGLQSIIISGDIPQKERDISLKKFRSDPEVNVMIGTTAMEMSLNLQCARFLILIDRLYNPARMIQIVGRLRRIGSSFKSIVVFNLMTLKTMEKGIYDYIAKKAATTGDALFDEHNDLFSNINPEDLLEILK